MRSIALKGTLFLIALARLFIFLCVFFVILSLALQFVDALGQVPILMRLDSFGDRVTVPLVVLIKKSLPYTYQGTDYSEILLLIFMFVLALWSGRLKEKVKQALANDHYKQWRQKISPKVSEEQLADLDSKFRALETKKGRDGVTDRKKLLEEFVLLKGKLDGMGQQLAFLAIDVVDSTGMKKDEDKHLVSYDFDNYNTIVLDCLKSNGVVKLATTPDGIMSCFRTVDDAVSAATTLLERLKHFNQHDKKIKREFVIRAGINSGFVYFDEDTPLEQISDRVIDIAGHMQKHAKPNSINIAASAIEPLKNRVGFNETVDVIDDERVYQWSSK